MIWCAKCTESVIRCAKCIDSGSIWFVPYPAFHDHLYQFTDVSSSDRGAEHRRNGRLGVLNTLEVALYGFMRCAFRDEL